MKLEMYSLAYRKNKDENYLKIFGKEFVKNNSNKCILIINNKKFSLSEYITIKNPQIDEVKIKLLFHKSIFDKRYMFKNCQSLIKILFSDKSNSNSMYDNNDINEEDILHNWKDTNLNSENAFLKICLILFITSGIPPKFLSIFLIPILVNIIFELSFVNIFLCSIKSFIESLIKKKKSLFP